MTFTVTVLGCAAMFATVERAASGYLLTIGTKRVWLDAGAGTWRNLLTHISYNEIDAVVLTHRHPDHTSDVFQAHHARSYGGPEPLPPLPLWAPQETLDALTALTDVGEAFDLRPVAAGDVIDLVGARASFHAMAHPPATVGVRVELEGTAFAYSADSGPAGDFDGLTTDASLFVCEATFQDQDSDWEGHLSARQAAEIAAARNVSHLVLSHLPSGRDLQKSLEEARSAAPGLTIELAEDNKTYEVVR